MDSTALDRYVALEDASFRVDVRQKASAAGYTAVVAELTSQRWLEPSEVDRTEWRHWLTIVTPERPRYRTGILLINGGSNTALPPALDPLLTLLAAETGAAVADLRAVPNQPLRFAGESAPLSEDALIAFTWRRFLDTGDERWPARLPMTKSVVRAMDAVTQLLRQENAGTVDRFILLGASKRGWTAWTAAAVDPRVVAVVPFVIDMLNLRPSFLHHYSCYGFWAPAVSDYVNRGIMDSLENPALDALLRIEDPYEYRGRLALPKYVVNSTGDQFFLPDSSRYYWENLPGEKYLRYVPNTDHALTPQVIASTLAWIEMILRGEPRPRFFWQADRAAGRIRVRAVDPPRLVLLWKAHNPAARDFRLETLGAAWKPVPVTPQDGVYEAAVDAPESGWTAFFLELTYEGPGGKPLVFTTEVLVVPDRCPGDAQPASGAWVNGAVRRSR
ncbi:MAG: PhoPQ-activated pathogenicity-related family protein [Bryobacteraceae bacterium]|nr:PhoPQ-activated pathogenicity-related family protein [Bryobacteraceae bacterium]